MGATGTATIAFGSTPTSEGSIAVTGQTGILSGSLCEAWIMGNDSTAGNTTTDHLFAGVSLKTICADVVAGTGFTIYATSTAGLVTGDMKVKWVWN